MRKARLALVAVAVVPVLAHVACGSDGSGSGTTPTPTPTPTATSSADAGTTPPPPTDAGTDSGPKDAGADTGVDAGPKTFSVGGTLVNVVGAGLVIQNNGKDDVTVAPGLTTFKFPLQITTGGAYAVTVKTHPAQQACKVTAGSGTIGAADVNSVVVDCSHRASCKQIKTDVPGAATGSYTIDPDGAGGAIAPFLAYCDMDFNDGAGAVGGWTLIESTFNGLGPSGLTEGVVAPGTASYLPLDTMKAIANLSSKVHLRTAGLAATESITSLADNEVITNLRAGYVVNEGLAGAAQVDRWAGPFANADRLSFTCPTSMSPWPSVYWACGNQIGLHLVSTHARWDWQAGNTGANLEMQVYVR